MRILKLTLLVVLCACTHSLYAQRHYAGVSALEFNYGMNMFGDCDNNLSLSVSKYKNRTTYWKIGLNYFEKSFDYKMENGSQEQSEIVSVNRTARNYYLDGVYYKTVASNLSSLYFNLGLGVFTGVESYKEDKDKYDYMLGPKLEAELEFFISGRMALLGRVKQYWSQFSDINEWNTVWNVGIKFLLY